MTAQMLVVLNSIFSFANKNGLCVNVKPSFYFSCVNFKCLFEWLWVWKVLIILIFHFIKPMMQAEDVCLRNGQVMPLISKEADGAQWVQRESVCLGTRLELREPGRFLYPRIKRATWPGSPGGLWTSWWPFDLPLPFQHCFCLAVKWC